VTDVAIIGGGPAGLAAAIAARQRNLSVTVYESKDGVIDKACGEGLMPPALKVLDELGVEQPPGVPFRGIRYVDGPHAAQADFSMGPGVGVRRIALHSALRARAAALGVEVVQQRVSAWSQDENGVTVEGRRFSWLVAADGLQSPIRKRLGLNVDARYPRRLGVRRHFNVAPWSEYVEVHWSEDAELYITPVSPTEIGVAILYHADAKPPVTGSPFERWLQSFPAVAERLRDPSSEIRGAGPFERRSRAPMDGRVLLIGDASGYLDPLTGEGIRLGLDTAVAAIESIANGRPDRYPRSWAKATRMYWWLTGALLFVRRRAWMRRRMVRVLRRAPWMMRLAIDALNRA